VKQRTSEVKNAIALPVLPANTGTACV